MPHLVAGANVNTGVTTMEHEATKQYLENLIAKQPNSITQSRVDTRKPLPESWVLKLFSKFQVIYGHKWLSVVDTGDLLELAIIEWSERLHDLTGEQIKHGLDNLDDDWVPTPMSFRKLCTGDDGLHKSGAYKPFENDASLTRIQHKVDRTAGRARVAELRKLINK